MGFLRVLEVILWILAVFVAWVIYAFDGPGDNLAFWRGALPILFFWIPPFFIHRQLSVSNSRSRLKSILLPILMGYIVVIVLIYLDCIFDPTCSV
ncbi:MAG: hypothetical protein IH840_10405 [Candidatus Heimdallarchaeota archaeon]|nr:hypothetical protein [Candidatus Heimdallarchaeota archaeon]